MNAKTSSPIDPEEFLKGLRSQVFGRTFYSFLKVTSTNDIASQLINNGATEGTLVIAEAQTQGRGRQGRRWSTSAGSALAFSLILKPKVSSNKIPGITLAAAVAVAKTLEKYGIKAEIKWPNDILIKGKKICGILTEMGPRLDNKPSVILGIGLNLNQKTADFPAVIRRIATSFYRFSGKRVDRVEFLRKLMKNLETVYDLWNRGQFKKVLGEWRKRSVTLGKWVKVKEGSGSFEGLVVNIDVDGFLLVRENQGLVKKVLSGDVVVLKQKKPKRRS